MITPLIFIPKVKPHARLRLICFSYAGGSSATYLSWQNNLNPNVELAVIQLPGRGIRLSEAPYETMREIVVALFQALLKLSSKPFVFYGHSMGSCVAYELTLMLHRFHYPLPLHFIASGSIAPCAVRKAEHSYLLPDEQFIAKLATLNGSPSEVLSNNEIMQLMLPTLRADFKIIETYHSKNKAVLPTKVSVLAGSEDKIELSDIELWFSLFESHTKIHWISGGHFFIDTNKADVLAAVNVLLAPYLLPSLQLSEVREPLTP